MKEIKDATIVQILDDLIVLVWDDSSGVYGKPSFKVREGMVIAIRLEEIKGKKCITGIWKKREGIDEDK